MHKLHVANDASRHPGEGRASPSVGAVFGNGQWLHDAYSGERVMVMDGQVTLNATGTVLLERAVPLLAR